MKKTALFILLVCPFFVLSQLDTTNRNKYNEKGLKQGVWKEIVLDEDKFIVYYNYQNGLKEGQYIVYDTSYHILIKGNYLNDTISGFIEDYYANGQLKCTYVVENDKLNGDCISYYENGNIKEERKYINDKLVGDYKWYYKNGQLRWYIQQDDINPEIKRYKYYHENGNIANEGIRVNEELDGIWNEYSEERLLIKRSVYKNGRSIR